MSRDLGKISSQKPWQSSISHCAQPSPNYNPGPKEANHQVIFNPHFSWLSKYQPRDSKVKTSDYPAPPQLSHDFVELQLQYTTFKNNLQQLAQKIGDVEQEAEEHK